MMTTGTYKYTTYTTGKEHVVEITEIVERNGVRYARTTVDGRTAKLLPIKLNKQHGIEYINVGNARTVLCVTEDQRIRTECEAGDTVRINGSERKITSVENYGVFVEGIDHLIPWSEIRL